jgi:undecaprenyl-diphosphatase
MFWSVVVSLTAAAALGAAAFGLVWLGGRTVRRLDAVPLLRSVAAGGKAGLSWITTRMTAQLLVLVAGSVMALALAMLFVEILDAVVENDDLVVLDQPVVQWISAHRPGWLTPFVVAVTDLGGKVLLTLAVTVAAVLVARRVRSWRPLLFAVCALGGSALLVAGIKVVIGRNRPDRSHQALSESGFAFPSGHSASALVGWALVAWLVCKLTTSRTVQAAAWVAAGMLAVAVGLSRTYLGVHYPSDVIGGWVLGAVWFTTVLIAGKLHPTGLQNQSRARNGTVLDSHSDDRALDPGAGSRVLRHHRYDALIGRFATVLSVSAIAALAATMGVVGTLAATYCRRSPIVDGQAAPRLGEQDDAWSTTDAPGPNVTSAQASQIALGHAGDGVTTDVELDWEHGMLVWSVDVWKRSTEYDVDIDASTGTVISYGPDD